MTRKQNEQDLYYSEIFQFGKNDVIFEKKWTFANILLRHEEHEFQLAQKANENDSTF